MPLSIVDVAKAAGVSHMTVSRVLNRNRGVRPENVAAVMKAVAELGYLLPRRKPGPKPKSRRKQARKVLLVVPHGPDTGAGFLSTRQGQDVLGGITHVADSRNIDVEIIPHAFNSQPVDVADADGMILITPIDAPAVPLAGMGPEFPLVVLPQNAPASPSCDCVSANEQMTGELAVEHLLAQGCTRIALITTDPNQAGTGDVYRGFRLTAERRDVPYDYVGPIAYHADGPDGPPVVDASPQTLVKQLASLKRTPDGLAVGVLSISDLYDALRQHGLEPVRKDPRPGKSVVIITPSVGELLTNPVTPMPHLLTYERLPAGRALLELLLRRIERPDSPVTHILIGPSVLQ